VRKINFDKIPLGRYGDPDEFGKAAVFLLSEAASYVTGETFIIDGGKMRTVW
jgi:3-oxoacyl-[acyl-carrier protein] reductase